MTTSHLTLKRQKACRVQPTNKPSTTAPQSFQPSLYDRRMHRWTNRPFLKQNVRCFLTVPIRYEQRIRQGRKQIASAAMRTTKTRTTSISTETALPIVDAEEDSSLVLAPLDQHGIWGCNVLLSVNENDLSSSDLSDLNIVRVSGTFASRVYSDASYVLLQEWILDMERWVNSTTGVKFDHEIHRDRFFVFCPSATSSDGLYYAVIFVRMDY